MTIYIEKTRHGYTITHFNPENGDRKRVHYLSYTLNNAIKAHRNNFNLHHKRLEKIYI